MTDFTPPCVLDDVPEHVYHQVEPWGVCLSHSKAALLLSQSPLHAWTSSPHLGKQAAEEEDGDATAARLNGTLLHALLLGGADLAPLPFDSYRTNASKDARDEAKAAGKIPVLEHIHDRAMVAAGEIAENIERAVGYRVNLFQAERTLLWNEGDVLCKARLDWWGDDDPAIIYDIKIVKRADPSAFGRAMAKWGHDLQDAAYRSAVTALHPELAGRVRLEFLLCEATAPFDVARVKLGPSKRALGESKWRRAVGIWKSCLDSGIWPGRAAAGAYVIEAEPWELRDDFAAELVAAGEPEWVSADVKTVAPARPPSEEGDDDAEADF